MLNVPPGALRTRPAPLVVFLHGALRTVDFFVAGHRAARSAIIIAPYGTNRGAIGANCTSRLTRAGFLRV